MELSLYKNYKLKMKPKIIALSITFALLLLTIIPICYPLLGYPFYLLKNSSNNNNDNSMISPRADRFITNLEQDKLLSSSSSVQKLPEINEKKCDIFSGEWVPNLKAPYYTNTTCWAIHEHQNCMKYGKPDNGYMKWKWKPDECELPLFNPAQFLEIMRGKSLGFVGDSIGRNQMQSLICLLSRVEYPIDDSYTTDENFMRWKYTTYNFTMAMFWTPHLVESKESDPNGPTGSSGLFDLYLDEPEEKWVTRIENFDYIIVSAGHWFYRPCVFYENRKIIGCHYCQLENVTDLGMHYGYRKAFKTTFKAINNLKSFKGVTYLRTFSPSHFENGLWNQGGNCLRTMPFKNVDARLEGTDLEFYMTQLEEFRIAEEEGEKKGLKFRLLDTTQAMLMRPDGHPSKYGHYAHENVTLYNDCVHWCLPGPIDTWSDFLLEMLKMEGIRAYDKIHPS